MPLAPAAAPADQALRVSLHVVDRDAAVRAGAGDLVDVDAEFARHAADRRRRRRRRLLSGAAGSAAARAPRLMSTTLVRDLTRRAARGPIDRILDARLVRRRRLVLGLDVGLDVRQLASPRPVRAGAACARAAAWQRPAFAGLGLAVSAARSRRFASSTRQDHLADLHLVAGLDLDVLDHARDRRRHFDRGLVGLELEHGLFFGDGVAGLTRTRRTSPPAICSPSSGSLKSVRPSYEIAGLAFSGLML